MKNTSPKICFIDFETTGIDVYSDEPIEIGAIIVNNESVVENKFHSRFQLSKGKNISNESFSIHGISDRDLLESPSRRDVIQRFFSTMGHDFCFASWNISFDVGFFKKVCHENDMMDKFNKVNYRHIDVQTISQVANRLGKFDSQINSLSDCINYFGLERSAHHNAYQDAELCFAVYKKLLVLISR
ncbi:exonuclease domain-containing protein [Hymenobacter artigasi]|uniref:DNA polymerase III epsilon subunit family exonuclease n=1 Tax=Hymenobacter artigasi TaxID=2719616 RepID=A0ABX1HR00_9BACT|nr:3'-5' exonuclease [Hymenobacter artigasi]NKI91643.1 DNA polymerase III epsilon subunit family exonuclease [Hymenobacter artigasi]